MIEDKKRKDLVQPPNAIDLLDGTRQQAIELIRGTQVKGSMGGAAEEFPIGSDVNGKPIFPSQLTADEKKQFGALARPDTQAMLNIIEGQYKNAPGGFYNPNTAEAARLALRSKESETTGNSLKTLLSTSVAGEADLEKAQMDANALEKLMAEQGKKMTPEELNAAIMASLGMNEQGKQEGVTTAANAAAGIAQPNTNLFATHPSGNFNVGSPLSDTMKRLGTPNPALSPFAQNPSGQNWDNNTAATSNAAKSTLDMILSSGNILNDKKKKKTDLLATHSFGDYEY